MPWNELISQKRVVDVLRRAVAADRVAHSYLFFGPQGVGKIAVAMEFAKTLLCERRQDEACGKCLSCTKVARLIHPDVHVLFPQPKDASIDELVERRRLLASDPYATVDFVRRPSLDAPGRSSNKQVQYHVGRIHEDLHRPMSFRPVEGRFKVAILADVHLMRTEAANAFLKLLEEPPPRTVFILTTDRPDRLLPTIISRCQQLRFDSLADDDIALALSSRAGFDRERATTLARMAGGSYSRALDLAMGDDLHDQRELVVRYLRFSYGGYIEELAETIDEIAALGREGVKNIMPLVHAWIRDLILYETMGPDAPLVNVDQIATIAKFCANLPDARLDDMVSLVEEARELAQRNVNLGLLLTALSMRLSEAMRGKAAERLYVPLAEPLVEVA